MFLTSVHAEQLLAQGLREPIHRVDFRLRIRRLLELLLQLLHFHETLLTHVHLLLHKNLLSALLSNICGIKLLKLVLVVLDHLFLLLSSHTVNLVILAQLVLPFNNTLLNG